MTSNYITIALSNITPDTFVLCQGNYWARILVQVTIYRRLLIGRDVHLDQSEAIRYIVTQVTIYRRLLIGQDVHLDQSEAIRYIVTQVTIYRRLLIGRDEHLDQSEACDIS